MASPLTWPKLTITANGRPAKKRICVHRVASDIAFALQTAKRRGSAFFIHQVESEIVFPQQRGEGAHLSPRSRKRDRVPTANGQPGEGTRVYPPSRQRYRVPIANGPNGEGAQVGADPLDLVESCDHDPRLRVEGTETLSGGARPNGADGERQEGIRILISTTQHAPSRPTSTVPRVHTRPITVTLGSTVAHNSRADVNAKGAKSIADGAAVEHDLGCH